jgi:hypothetical protein
MIRKRATCKDLQSRLSICDELIRPLSPEEYQHRFNDEDSRARQLNSGSNWNVIWTDSDEMKTAILALNYRLRFESCLQNVTC